MSESEEVKEYEVLNDPIGDKGRGETITLKPSVASAFEDNLVLTGEDRPEEAVRSQVIGRRRVATLSDLPPGEEIEAGEYEVYRDPIGDVEPGETARFEADIARAFADNLLAPGENDDVDVEAEREGEPPLDETVEETDGSDSDGGRDGEGSEGEGEGEGGDNGSLEIETMSYDSPREMLEETDTVENLTEVLAGADLDDGQLEKLLDAEEGGENRKSAKEVIRSQMSGE